MSSPRIYRAFVLLLYLKVICGQQISTNNQNIGGNNVMELQQQALQRASSNLNQMPNRPNGGGGINNGMVQSNFQTPNIQQPPSLPGIMQGNMQQPMNLPPNLQSQGVNNLQITKIGFSPMPPGVDNPSNTAINFQNGGVIPNGQLTQPQVQNIAAPNFPMMQVSNGPISTFTLGDTVGLKGQSLMSLFNAQNNGQLQENQRNIVPNTLPMQNQLTEMQKQFLVRTFQAHNSAMNQQQDSNMVQNPPKTINMDNQQAINVRVIQTPQQVHPILTPLNNQPPYITVQAQPLTEYLLNQPPASAVEDPILSAILSELGPQYKINTAYPPPKKGSKINLKTLVPLIINLIKEKRPCGCRNCKCHNKAYQNNDCSDTSIESQIAQVIGGYSRQKTYGQGTDDSASQNVQNNENKPKSNDKQHKLNTKKTVAVDTEEISEEDVSEYVDDE